MPYPCIVGKLNVTNRGHSVMCFQCEEWCHTDCTGLTHAEYKTLTMNYKKSPFRCKSCQTPAATPQVQLALDESVQSLLDTSCQMLADIEHLAKLVGRRCKKKHLRVASLNIQGLQSSYHELKQLLLVDLGSNLDILLLQETWISPGADTTPLGISGYKLLSNPRTSNIHGGTAAYVRSHLAPTIVRDLTWQSQGIAYEQLCVEVKLSRRTKLTVISGYKPPSVPYQEALAKIEATVEMLLLDSKAFVIAGDFNLNVQKPRDPGVSQLNDVLDTYPIKQLVGQPTRLRGQSATLIDLMVIPDSMRALETIVASVDISDHCLVASAFNLIVEVQKPRYKLFRNYRAIDHKEFCRDLESGPWELVQHHLDAENLDQAVTYFTQIIQSVLNTHAPERKVKIPSNTDPWITTQILAWRRWKNRLYKGAIRSKLAEDWDEYKRIRNYYQDLLRCAKRDYFERAFADRESARNPNFWPIIKELNQKHCQDQLVNPSKPWTDCLNGHFSTIGEKTFREARETGGQNDITADQVASAVEARGPQFGFVPPTTSQIKKIISKLGNFKASGEDGINGFILKLAKDTLAPWLSGIARKSFELGEFPSSWKKAVVVPIHKAGDALNPSNYRPISLLSISSKVLERAAFDQLNSYFEQNGLICNNQSGFRRARSTETAMVRVCSDLIDSIDEGKISILVLLDLSKAFDCVPHDILLKKLENYGLEDDALKWAKSYLSDRTQSVRTGTVISDTLQVTTGVPQGSINGPFFFGVVNNDLPKGGTEELRNSVIPQFKLPRANLTAGQRSFRFTGPKMLNEALIDLKITDLDSLKLGPFKAQLKL